MSGIGIIGSGVAGLHLGLLLRQHDVPVTIYSEKSAEQLAGGRLPNSVAHHNTTVLRERALGVEHWDLQEYGYFCHHHYLGGPHPLRFPGSFEAPSRAIDYRIYLPKLLEDYQERGGEFQVRPIQAADILPLSEKHDLVVVGTGKGSMGAMFPRIAAKSPYDAPQRKLCVGLYHGIVRSEPRGVTMSVSPGHGELLEIPMYSFEGHVTALLFENVPGGDLEVLANARYDEDPAAFEKLVLEKTQQHHPTVFERIDPARFRLTRPEDLLQGAVVPTVREDYVRLPNGRYTIAVGDVHTVVDPVIGQGANSASYSAWELGHAIVEDPNFDERFCRKVARRRRDRVHSISDWTNLMIQTPPPPHLLELFGAMAENPAIADEFTNNFNFPERQWDILATPERARKFLARHGR
ncbi:MULTISPECIES: styrene monooxygenase subunit StyA [Amycolatopsis]|uniref:2-polyprenyl-6-methoxyphenol hydroxylase n=2 Tax=Amycolatopsis TaxID=1813 RepID=A0A1I3RJI9_9PSEU|nr:styrene monooxygenase/indole monooxygenase family protein [Amycolatopsis sacchari]SFJ46200.1 2-polyprenyl-6-methoxyphenol hydroxylase [Amycolatopsis sacchari]